MKQVQITEALLRDGVTVYRKDDVVSVDDDKAQLWVDNGWAKDPVTGEQGERVPGAKPIKPNKVSQKVS